MTNVEVLQSCLELAQSIDLKIEFIIGLSLFLLIVVVIVLGVKFFSRIFN